MSVQVQEQDFDLGFEIEKIYRQNPSVGAVATFVGLMRDVNDGQKISKMVLEHYPAMTEKALTEIQKKAESRWSLEGVRIVHRYGKMEPNEKIVLVVVASAHRRDAFEACQFLMDYLKTSAPFWKKESSESGDYWVDSRSSDEEAVRRWD